MADNPTSAKAQRITRGLTISLTILIALLIVWKTLNRAPNRNPTEHIPGWRPVPGAWRPDLQTIHCLGADRATNAAAYRQNLTDLHILVRPDGEFLAARKGQPELPKPFVPTAGQMPNGATYLTLSDRQTPDGRLHTRWEAAKGGQAAVETRTFEDHNRNRFACSVLFRPTRR